MISDFLETFPVARRTLEEADEILKFPLSKIIREGPPVSPPTRAPRTYYCSGGKADGVCVF
jgi:hypothetical protein